MSGHVISKMRFNKNSEPHLYSQTRTETLLKQTKSVENISGLYEFIAMWQVTQKTIINMLQKKTIMYRQRLERHQPTREGRDVHWRPYMPQGPRRIL